MRLDPKDDTTGYEGTPAVVGQLRLNDDGWFNYFGFPEKPMPESPFEFRPSGQVVKALTYGNLGTGGLSTAGFEQTLPDDHPIGRHIPGLRHAHRSSTGRSTRRATTARSSPTARRCSRARADVRHDGDRRADRGQRHERRHVPHGRDGQRRRDGRLGRARSWSRTARSAARSTATGAEAVQLFGSTVNGAARIASSTRDVTIAGSTFRGGLTLTGNTQVTASERYSRLAGAYGPILAGSTVNGTLECSANSADVKDFGAPNTIARRLQRLRAGARSRPRRRSAAPSRPRCR